MAAAQLLKTTHTADDAGRVRGVADVVLGVDNRIAGVDDRLADVRDQLSDQLKNVGGKVMAVMDGTQYIFN